MSEALLSRLIREGFGDIADHHEQLIVQSDVKHIEPFDRDKLTKRYEELKELLFSTVWDTAIYNRISDELKEIKQRIDQGC